MIGGLVLAGCDLPRFGAPDSASEEGDHVLSLWSGFFIAACAVVLLIWGLLAWVLIRYRRKGRDDIPNQRAYNIPLEILYTIIPVLIVAVLFAFSWRAERKVTDVASDPAVEVRVVGFQWGWQFQYADGFTVTADAGEDPVLVLPVGEATNLELVSVDVAHSFWVPDFLNKRDLIPGVDNTITVRPTRTGTFVGRCAEFCGLDHWRMQFSVEVVSAAEYEQWAAAQPRRDPPELPAPPSSADGQQGGAGDGADRGGDEDRAPVAEGSPSDRGEDESSAPAATGSPSGRAGDETPAAGSGGTGSGGSVSGRVGQGTPALAPASAPAVTAGSPTTGGGR